MLPSNGKKSNGRRSYHMTIEELAELLHHVRLTYDTKFYVLILTQFCMGMRASEALNIQIMDFKDKFKYLDYREAKTNEMRYNEPIPEYLSQLIKEYCYYNIHRFKDGYIFPNYTGKGQKITINAYEALFAKWRKQIGKKNPRFLDKYDFNKKLRYRINTHSLRRLHRTVLKNNIKDLYIVKELCNYKDYKTLERYINHQDIMEQKEAYLLPVINPVVNILTMQSKGQTNMLNYMEPTK